MTSASDDAEFVLLALGKIFAEQQKTNRLLEAILAAITPNGDAKARQGPERACSIALTLPLKRA